MNRALLARRLYNGRRNKKMALPFGETPRSRDSRSLAALARSIYSALREKGFRAKDIVALTGELLGHLARDVRAAYASRRER